MSKVLVSCVCFLVVVAMISVIHAQTLPSYYTTYKVAGTMTAGVSSGDNGPANSARFNVITALAVHQELYMLDTTNQNIRKIENGTGVVRKVAGNTRTTTMAIGTVYPDPTTCILNVPCTLHFGQSSD